MKSEVQKLTDMNAIIRKLGTKILSKWTLYKFMLFICQKISKFRKLTWMEPEQRILHLKSDIFFGKKLLKMTKTSKQFRYDAFTTQLVFE